MHSLKSTNGWIQVYLSHPDYLTFVAVVLVFVIEAVVAAVEIEGSTAVAKRVFSYSGKTFFPFDGMSIF